MCSQYSAYSNPRFEGVLLFSILVEMIFIVWIKKRVIQNVLMFFPCLGLSQNVEKRSYDQKAYTPRIYISHLIKSIVYMFIFWIFLSY